VGGVVGKKEVAMGLESFLKIYILLPLFWRQKSGGKNRRPAKNFDKFGFVSLKLPRTTQSLRRCRHSTRLRSLVPLAILDAQLIANL
ncbi:hypothetical protein KJ866_03235, partial [Patescibacteria group bacterium]|nr:hypothetical protein [Patescibacteria group bacterium]